MSIHPQHQMSGQDKRVRATTLILLVALGAGVLVWRCQQFNDKSVAALDEAHHELARVLADGASVEDDIALARTRELFVDAARASLQDMYAAFCVSAIDELLGDYDPPSPPSAAWEAAVILLRAGRLDEAAEAFDSLEPGETHWAGRRTAYLGLIRRLTATDGDGG